MNAQSRVDPVAHDADSSVEVVVDRDNSKRRANADSTSKIDVNTASRPTVAPWRARLRALGIEEAPTYATLTATLCRKRQAHAAAALGSRLKFDMRQFVDGRTRVTRDPTA
jgi:hypothetical protein